MRVQRTLQVSLGAADPRRAALLLAELLAAPPETIEIALGRAELSLFGALAADELDCLSAALSGADLRFRPSAIVPDPSRRSERFVLDTRLSLQVGSVVALAGGAAWAGVPIVAWLGVPVVVALGWASTERVPTTFALDAQLVDERLGPVDRAVWNELGVIARGLRRDDGRAAARRCLVLLCSVIERIRAHGLHLVRPDFASLDGDAHALMRRSLRLVAAADRAAEAAEEPGLSEPRRARLETARRELFAALSNVEQKLDALRLSLVELSGLTARADGLAAASTRLTELQVAVETGLELSSLTHEEPARSLRPRSREF